MSADDQRLEDDADTDTEIEADTEPAPPPAEVIAEIASSERVPFERLRALSEPDDETVQAFLTLWPRLAPERRRELLASLERLAEDNATLDFHRIHLSALRDDDPATRILAVRGLREQDRPEYLHVLMDLLRDDQEATVRSEIADVLGEWVVGAEFGMLSPDESDLLCSALRELIEDVNEEDEVRGRALEALGARSEEWVSEVISEAYELGSHRLRLAALRAMGRNADDNWLPVLLHNFDDVDSEVRAAAATAAGQLLLDGALDPLTELISDAEEEVQLAAVYAIGEIAGDAAERVLTAVLGRPEQRLVDAARAALDGATLLRVDLAADREEEA